MSTKKQVSAQKPFDLHHALVIGGSMAGLLAAHVLSEHFERVTIVERDQLVDDGQPRKGVPQGWHAHGLLVGGAVLLETLFPGLFATLAQDGAVQMRTSEIHRYQLGGWLAAIQNPDRVFCWPSRPFLEGHVRAALSERPNIHLLDGCSVMRLKIKGERITGVVLQHRHAKAGEEELAANLVVDASGHSSRAPQWLASFGYGQVEESRVKIDIGYATRIYRCPDPLPTAWKVLSVLGVPPHITRAGVIFPLEGGYWIVTLVGWLRDYPPDDAAGFLDFAHSLAQPDVYEAIKEAEPITPISVYRYPAHRWRHYERLPRLPEGFLVLGDAVCSFNPVYGQGMAVAAMEAKTLDTCLREQQYCSRRHIHAASFQRHFQKAIAREVKSAWMLSTGEDLLYPGTEGRRSLATRLFNRYLRRVIELSAVDLHVTMAFFQVWHLLKPLRALFAPPVVWAVLRREVRLLWHR